MPRVLRVGNFGVYVYDERGAPHHLPHAHINRRGQRVASIYLMTLVVYHQDEDLPKALLEEIRKEQDALLAKWEELNPND